jgi:hypothetical protein
MTEQMQGNPGSSDSIPLVPVREFRNTQNILMTVTASFGISLLMIIVIAVNLYLLFLSSSNKPMMPGLIGGMSVIPIFGIAAGIYFLKRPRKIIISSDGVAIVGLISRKDIPWPDIADIEINEAESIADNWVKTFSGQSAVQKKRVILRDGSRRQLGTIEGNIEEFDTLMAMIISNSSQSRGKPVFDAGLQKNRTMTARKKKMRLNLGLGLFLSLMAIASMVVISVDHVSQKTLETQGQAIDAVISKHYKYNVTPRLEYTFTADDGKSYTKDAMVEKTVWEQLKEGDTIPVKYVPSNPDNSRLLKGYVDDFDVPFPLMIIMGGAILALGAGCACMYFLKIVDIKHENGKWIIVRLNDPELLIAPSSPVPAVAPQIQTQAVPVFSPVAQSPQCPAAPQGKQKLPGGLKAIGILNIIFGSIGILFNSFRIVFVLAYMINPEAFPFSIEMTGNSGWILAGHSLALLCALALCISGIGILRFANWGRILALTVVSIKIIMGLWEIAGVFRLPVVETVSQEQAFIINTSKAFYIFIAMLVLIYPVIVFILLNRRSTRQCFRNKIST